MSNIQPYIILNDIDSRTISGLLISSLPPISKPLQRTQVETVDGRDGDLVTPLGFSAYDKVITIGLTYGYDIDDVIEYFNSEGVVVFSNEPDKFYRYAIYEQIDFEKLIRFKKAEVTLHCQPFKFSMTEDPKLFNVVSGQAITVKNNGNIYSRPDITVIGSGEVDLSLNGSQVLSLELSDNQAVIIDAEDMNAYAAQSAIREVVADVDPIQDLNGYGSVWIGGAGKNLLDYLTNLRSLSSGLTITATADGAIHYQGTADQVYCQLTYTIPLSIASGTTITVSRDKSVNYQHYFSLTYIDDSIEYLRILANTTSATITLSKELKSIDIVCLGLTVNSSYNETIKFQLEKGSSATAWTPYENICEISGSYACNLNLCGKNLANIRPFNEWQNVGAYKVQKSVLPENENFIMSLIDNDTSVNISGVYFGFVDSAYTGGTLNSNQYRWIIKNGVVQNDRSNTAEGDINKRLSGLVIYPITEETYNKVISRFNIEIESTSSSDYNAYLGSKYKNYFEGLTKGTYGFVDLGSLTWSYNSGAAFQAFTTTSLLTTIRKNTNDSTIASWLLCQGYTSESINNTIGHINDKRIAVNSLGQIYLSDFAYTDAATFTEAVSGVYLIYELASATTPTITQEDINTLLSAFDDTLISTVFGQTVYGGSLNVTTGELTITRNIIDLSTLNWVYASGSKRWEAQILNMKTYPSRSADIIFEKYETDTGATIGSEGKGFISGLVVYITSNDNTTTPSGNACYPLATPTIVQLTPAQVNNLLGVNTLYADTGDLTVSHKSNGVIVTNTGAIVSFTVAVDDMEKGALLNRLVTGDYDKIRLKKGDNTIVLTGNAQQFVIDKYSRWI